MLKFKYHYLTNTLFTQEPFRELWEQVSTDQQFTGNFAAQGFILEPSNHWISFQIKEKFIQAFYKFPQATDLTDFAEQKVTYYRKYLAKEERIIFTFDFPDEVEKREGKWSRKEGIHA